MIYICCARSDHPCLARQRGREVGYPQVSVRDVEEGKTVSFDSIIGLD
jgi:hypothetical protein